MSRTKFNKKQGILESTIITNYLVTELRKYQNKLPQSPIKNLGEWSHEKLELSFQKWEGHRIQQLSFFNNLVITLATGFLVVVGNELLEKSRGFKWTLISMALSIIVGIIAALSRLIDFRLTTNICDYKKQQNKRTPKICNKNDSLIYCFFTLIETVINYQPLHKTSCEIDLRRQRQRSHNLGRLTWSTVIFQVLFFMVGIGLFLIMTFNGFL